MKLLSATFTYFLFNTLAAGMGHAQEIPCSNHTDPYECSSGEIDTGCVWCSNLEHEGYCVAPGDKHEDGGVHGVMCELLEDIGGERNLRFGSDKNDEQEIYLSDFESATITDAILKLQDNNNMVKSNDNGKESRKLQGWSTWTVAVDCYDSYLSATNSFDKITVEFYSASGRLLGERTSEGGLKDCSLGKYEFWTIGSMYDVYSWSIQTDGSDAFYIDEIYLVKDYTDIKAYTFKNYCLSNDPYDHITQGWNKVRVVDTCRPKYSFFYF